jgi:hypothetical protein
MPKKKAAVKRNPNACFDTTCPKCGENGDIYVVFGRFKAIGLPLSEDGFAFTDAQQMETDHEVCLCCTCQETFPLSEVTL